MERVISGNDDIFPEVGDRGAESNGLRISGKPQAFVSAFHFP
ncbi:MULTISPECIES: hypothetical protein [Rhizobium]|nr:MULTISPECIES: hypothetical protein [Rhizobium]